MAGWLDVRLVCYMVYELEIGLGFLFGWLVTIKIINKLFIKNIFFSCTKNIYIYFFFPNWALFGRYILRFLPIIFFNDYKLLYNKFCS